MPRASTGCIFSPSFSRWSRQQCSLMQYSLHIGRDRGKKIFISVKQSFLSPSPIISGSPSWMLRIWVSASLSQYDRNSSKRCNCPRVDWKWTNFSTRCWWNWQTGDGLAPIYANTSNKFEFENCVCWKTSISNNFVSHTFAHTSSNAIRNNPWSLLFFHSCIIKK